jgi:hypothetical protein
VVLATTASGTLAAIGIPTCFGRYEVSMTHVARPVAGPYAWHVPRRRGAVSVVRGVTGRHHANCGAERRDLVGEIFTVRQASS